MIAPSACNAVMWTTAFLFSVSPRILPWPHPSISLFCALLLSLVLASHSFSRFLSVSKPPVCNLQDADLFALDSLVASSTPYQLLISVLPGATPRAWIHLYHNAQVCYRRYRGAGRLCRRLLAYGVPGTCWPGTNGPDCLSRPGFASHARYSRLVG